jgi:quercetin dioxygenase-like cupin family protein
MNLVAQNAMMALETEMNEHPERLLEDGRKIELETIHHFAPGLYARELRIPAGVLLTGKIHKTEHLNILAKGRIEISNMGESKELIAPQIFVSPPGTKRAGYAHEDSVWITIHPTEETDMIKLEQDLVTNSFDEIEYKPVIEVDK